MVRPAESDGEARPAAPPGAVKRLLLALLLLGALLSGTLLFRSIRPAPRPARAAATKNGEATASEREAIARAVRSLAKGARVALDDDGNDTDSRREMENVYAGYHPYFVRGDLDGDGLLDFSQAFVTKRSGKLWFDVAVFFGAPGGGFTQPVWVERGISLADGDVSIERSLLVLTPDLSRDETRRWRWEPEERRFVDADATPAAAPSDEDVPDETPDERPRVRA